MFFWIIVVGVIFYFVIIKDKDIYLGMQTDEMEEFKTITTEVLADFIYIKSKLVPITENIAKISIIFYEQCGPSMMMSLGINEKKVKEIFGNSLDNFTKEYVLNYLLTIEGIDKKRVNNLFDKINVGYFDCSMIFPTYDYKNKYDFKKSIDWLEDFIKQKTEYVIEKKKDEVVIYLPVKETKTVSYNNIQTSINVRNNKMEKSLNMDYVEMQMFLARTAVSMYSKNVSVEVGAYVFEHNKTGYLVHSMIFILNKNIPMTINLDNLILIAKTHENEKVKEHAVIKLMEYMDLNISEEDIIKFKKYLEYVQMDVKMHDSCMVMLQAQYKQEVAPELITDYKKIVFATFRKKMEHLSGMSQIDENGQGIEIKILDKTPAMII